MAGRFSIETVFKAIDRVTAPVTRMQNSVGKFTRTASRGLRDLSANADRFSGGMRRMGTALLASGLIASAAFGNVIKTGADFEQAITNVGAVSLQTRDQIQDLEKMALHLGRTTKFTATQAANAMEIMARAGFDVNAIMEATPAVLSAAAASGLEIAEVADHVSNVLKGMGLETDQAARVADVLALASARTNSTIGSLGESMRNVASTARQLNVPLENVVASVALLQDVGLDASVAGSAMNVMLTQMAVPSDNLRKLMGKLGISFKDAKGDMLPLSEVIGQLSKGSAQLGGNFDKVAFLAELVGLRGQKAAANLVPLFESNKLDTLVQELENAEGAALRMANIRMDTTLGSFTLLMSAIDGVKVRAFGLTGGPLKAMLDQWTKWVSLNEELIATRIGEFLASIFGNMDRIVDKAVKIAKLVATIWALVTALKAVSLILGIVNALMLMNPVGLLIAAIGLLIAGLAALVIWWDEVKAGFLIAFDPIISVLKWINDKIVGMFVSVANLGHSLFGDDEETQQTARRPGGVGLIGPGQAQPMSGELRVSAEPGTSAAVVKQSPGLGITLQQSGAF